MRSVSDHHRNHEGQELWRQQVHQLWREQRDVAASICEVAGMLGDTPAVARTSSIDQQLISRYEPAGELAAIPALPVALPVPTEAEIAVAALLAGPG